MPLTCAWSLTDTVTDDVVVPQGIVGLEVVSEHHGIHVDPLVGELVQVGPLTFLMSFRTTSMRSSPRLQRHPVPSVLLLDLDDGEQSFDEHHVLDHLMDQKLHILLLRQETTPSMRRTSTERRVDPWRAAKRQGGPAARP